MKRIGAKAVNAQELAHSPKKTIDIYYVYREIQRMRGYGN
jgi:hypothetical protein